MLRRQKKATGSSALHAAVESLKRPGYAVGSPAVTTYGRACVMVGGKVYWEEQAVEMADRGYASPEKDEVQN